MSATGIALIVSGGVLALAGFVLGLRGAAQRAVAFVVVGTLILLPLGIVLGY